MSFCLDTYLQQSEDYKILLSQSGFKDCAKAVEDNSKEIVHINPGDKVLGIRINGFPPIPVGINPDKKTVCITYTKPCNGTSAIELPVSDEEINDILMKNIDYKH